MNLVDICNYNNYPSVSVAFTETAASTSLIPAGPEGFVIWSDSACYFLIGENPTVSITNGTPIPQNTMVPVKIPQSLRDRALKVSAVRITTSGTLYVIPVLRV